MATEPTATLSATGAPTGTSGATQSGSAGTSGAVPNPAPNPAANSSPSQATPTGSTGTLDDKKALSLNDSAKPPEQKDATPPDTKPKEPLKLTWPKDSLIPQAQMEKIAAQYGERGFSQEQAQAALEMQSQGMSEYRNTLLQSFDAQKASWQKAFESHPEYGGENSKAWGEEGHQVMMKYGGPEMVQMLTETGYAKHPAVAKLIWNLVKASRQDKLVAPRAQAVSGEKTDLADRLFPSTSAKR